MTNPLLEPAVFSRDEAPVRPEGAVVLGGGLGSLGIARSLGRRGVPVCLLTNDHLLTKFSRYVRCAPAWPKLADQSAEVECLLDLADRHGLHGWALFPGGDPEAEMIARNHDKLAAIFHLTTPPWNVLRWAYDKRLIYRRAAELGIDQPPTYNPRSLAELASLDCRFPMVLKPAIKRTGSALEAAKGWRVDSRAELLARYAEACTQMDCDAILAQEIIPASGQAQCSYGGLWADGRALASMTAQCLRQFPIDFGCATYVRTVEDPEVEEISARFLRGIGYTGLVEIEYKRDPRDGRYKMLDVNPRTWAWHSLSRRAGIDFPHLEWLRVSGAPVPPARAQAGIAWIHMARDIIAAQLEIRRGKLSLAEYVRSLRGPLEFAAFAPDDPFPGCMDLPLLAHRAVGRAARMRTA
jgi:predicted ATP-grasp superfamily ATP-dependent carboligase